MRLFVSVGLDGLAEEVQRAQRLVSDADGIRLADPSQAHVTLTFLGETDSDRLSTVCAELEEAVEDSGVGPFRASFGGLGVFPSPEYISVVWLGVREGGRALTQLHEAVESRMTDLGFDPADHEFTPHATIARMDHAGGKGLVQSAVRERDPDAGARQVEEVRLTESVLTEDGPEHTTVESVELCAQR